MTEPQEPNDNTETEPSAPAVPPLVIKDVKFEKSATRPTHYPKEPLLPQVAFVGRSNVGKSTLLNTLVNRKRLANVSNTPGRTQLINFFVVNDQLRLVDLPGYGFAKAPKTVKAQWEHMISDYLRYTLGLRLVLTLFDMRRDPNAEDESLLDWLAHHNIPFAAVLTKADKLTHSERIKAAAKLRTWLKPREPRQVIVFSSMTRLGREELLQLMGTAMASDGGNADTGDGEGDMTGDGHLER